MTFRTTSLLIATTLATAVGCGGDRDGNSSTGQGTAPVQSAWTTYYTANPATQNDAVKTILPITSGTSTGVLVGHSTGPINFIDENGIATLEGSFGNVSKLIQTPDGRVFASTAEPFFSGINGTNGQVYERDANGLWTLSLDHPLGGAVVAALDSQVYAFASQFGIGSDSTVSYIGSNSQWVQDVANIGSMQVLDATAHNGELWAAGSENNATRAAPRLIRGSGANFVDVTLPNTPALNQVQLITDLLSVGPDLYMTIVFVDTLGQQAMVTGGEVLVTSDNGQTFSQMIAFTQGEAPISVGWHDSALYVGTILGRVYSEQVGVLVEDTSFPTNAGVFTFEKPSAGVLLAGLRGNSGAEMVALGSTTVQQQPQPQPSPSASPQPSPSPSPQPVLNYVTDIKPILLAGQCATCHGDPANSLAAVAQGVFLLSQDMADNTADYAAVQQEINLGNPAASTLLLKVSGDMGATHAGGTPWAVGSSQYNTISDWITGSAPFN